MNGKWTERSGDEYGEGRPCVEFLGKALQVNLKF